MIGHVLLSFLLTLSAASIPSTAAPAGAPETDATALYREMRLDGVLPEPAFDAAYTSVQRHGITPKVLAIADMSQPSTAKRLYVLDLTSKTVALRTWVAHGSGSGGLMADRFSNRDGSHQTSLGLYRVGKAIVSPKHGKALALDGLDKGVNDNARGREVIVHGASYVSAAFIAQHGYLGRSWGCPAVSVKDMGKLIDLLGDGGLLYVYGG